MTDLWRTVVRSPVETAWDDYLRETKSARQMLPSSAFEFSDEEERAFFHAWGTCREHFVREMFALAARQCIFDDGSGLTTDDGGTPYCTMQKHVDLLTKRCSVLAAALSSANLMCRSAFQIAQRAGADTNWEAFGKRLQESLQQQHEAMYGRTEGRA